MLTRAAGILIPLFSLRTPTDLGSGEITDLLPFSDFALAMGHRVIQLLPLTESSPGDASPYNALSTFAIDPLAIGIAELQGVSTLSVGRARRSSRAETAYNRARVAEIKFPLLHDAWSAFQSRQDPSEGAAFDEFLDRNREWLDDYVLFRAIKERLQWIPWTEWPDELRRREPGAIATARALLADELRMTSYWQFIAWSQWEIVRQKLAERRVQIGGDLAFLPALDSADVWSNQELFILDQTVGTPPDAFSETGQRWGLPMPNWDRMRADDFSWWRMRARIAARLYDLFRVDHVVGLYRTYSFGPDDDDPGEFYPGDENEQLAQGEAVLRAIRLEAGTAAVIAEDLGTVPPWVRESLLRLGIPGYKVMRWEKEDWGGEDERFISPEEYPELSVATTGTHDTETLSEWWRTATEVERRKMIEILSARDGLVPESPKLDSDGLDAILETLYRSPSRLAIVPIQDLFGWEDRINVPGTISDTNWSWRLPVEIEKLRTAKGTRSRIEKLRSIVEKADR